MKKIVIGLLFCLSLAPSLVMAESNNGVEQKAAMQELIEKLLEQIAVLQKQLDAIKANKVVSFVDTTASRYETVASYPVSSVSAVDLIADASHRNYFTRVLEVFPKQYEDRIAEFVIFVDGDHQADSYVETIPAKSKKWVYGVSEGIIGESNSAVDTELVVHEFSHILSYDQIVGMPQPANSTCPSYFKSSGCPLESSYLRKFSERFWSEEDLERAERFAGGYNPVESAHDYYEDHATEFVSDYAALNPEEDFAESFVQYVIQSEPAEDTIKDRKVLFFYQYPELLSLRNEIRWNR